MLCKLTIYSCYVSIFMMEWFSDVYPRHRLLFAGNWSGWGHPLYSDCSPREQNRWNTSYLQIHTLESRLLIRGLSASISLKFSVQHYMWAVNNVSWCWIFMPCTITIGHSCGNYYVHVLLLVAVGNTMVYICIGCMWLIEYLLLNCLLLL